MTLDKLEAETTKMILGEPPYEYLTQPTREVVRELVNLVENLNVRLVHYDKIVKIVKSDNPPYN